MEKLVVVSGGFDPIHVGHLRLFEEAGKLGKLMVVVNSDQFLIRKKGYCLMPLSERLKIVASIRGVWVAIPAIDKDDTVCKTLDFIKPHIFANGGDRTVKNVPETEVCRKHGIKMVFGVGGDKVQSSSNLVQAAVKKFVYSERR